MKMNDLRERLRGDRPMTTISLRIPEDVVAQLKHVAPLLGFSGYQPLIRAYLGASNTKRQVGFASSTSSSLVSSGSRAAASR